MGGKEIMEKVAFALIGGGVVILIGYFCRGFFTAAGIPLVLRIAVGIVGLGLVLLLASIGWRRYKSTKKDDFKEVER